MQPSHPAESPHSGKTIWVFTPSRTDPKDLEFILVQRQSLLRDAVERVQESALTNHKHHLLFVGPRGCGKTHLVTLIVSRLAEDESLTNHLRIAWLNEDETCTTLLELLLKIHAALEKRYPAEFHADMLSPAYDLKQDAALEFVSKHLLSALGSRTLLVVTENLDAIFEGLGDSGQKQLRSFIQENPRLSIVATAQRLVEDLSNRNSPFFGFFQTEHLKPLTVTQATELLQNIARLQNKDSVVDFLATSQGRSRVRAIHHLSGGNHRIYIVLSQFITRDSVDALLEPFMKMVDELTPHYQERIRWLPPLQRKIVEHLCTCEGTVPVKDIARRLFATPQTISSQLQDLREKGYVEANQRGRESLYEISEPLMRICVEVKDNQRLQPLRLLVDFLRVWYDDQDLKLRLDTLKPASTSFSYLQSAIQKNRTDGNLRKQILLDHLQLSLPEETRSVVREGMVNGLKNAPEELLLALQSMSEKMPADAVLSLNEAIAEEASPATKVGLLLVRAIIHSELEDRAKEIADYTAVIDLPGAPAKHVAKALLNRGLAHLSNGRKIESRSDFETLIRLRQTPVESIVYAHLFIAENHFSDGRWSEGFQYLEASFDRGAKAQPAYRGNPAGLIGVIFSAGLNPEGRRSKVAELLRLYQKHQALPALGAAVVQHIGSIYRSGEPFPSSDNLEGWRSAWEQASEGVPDLRLSIRLLNTSIAFLRTGGKDRSILLNLASAERSIVDQAFGPNGEPR